MLEKEFKFYRRNQKKLVKENNGKYVVIKKDKLIGIYSSENEAFDETIKENEIGTFFIQKCLPGERNYTQTFNTRVIF